MTTITAEGAKFDYVTADAAPVDFDANLAVGSSTRLAWFENCLDRSKKDAYWLVWQHDKDLRDLDRRVLSLEYTDVDFEYALRAELMQNLRCPGCSKQFVALVVDPALPYLNSPGLNLIKIRKMKIMRCAACGSFFRLLVAKILREVHAERVDRV